MFEPECQNIYCPQCLAGKIYFDREIGYYCMLCGRRYNAADVEMLVEKAALTGRPAQESEMGRKKSTVEIKDMPPQRAKVEHISRDAVNRNKPDR